MLRAGTLVAATAAALALASPAPAATTLNIIPHGQFEPGVPWASTPGLLPDVAKVQARMYDRITPLYRNITPNVLTPSTDGTGYYKSAALLPENDPSFISSETASGTAPGVGAVSATSSAIPTASRTSTARPMQASPSVPAGSKPRTARC